MNTKHLKAKILDLAIRGKLVPQDPSEGNASDLLQKIRDEKSELVKQKKIKEDKNASFIIKTEDGKHYEQFADGSLKDIEDEIPFEIPENWCWCRLKEISIISTGSTPLKSNKKYYENGTIPFITSADTSKTFVNKAQFFITQLALEENHLEINPIGSLIVAMYGEGKTRGQITELSIPATTNQACAVIKIIDDNEILRTFVKNFFFYNYENIRRQAKGGNQANLNLTNIGNIYLPLPPLSEQQRIVSAIEKAFEQIDIIEKNKLNLKTYIKQTKSKVLDLAIHGKLVEQNPQEGNAFELLEKIRREKAELIEQKKLKEDKNASFIFKAEDGKHYEQFADGSLKDVEEDIPFEIPENWCWCRIFECSECKDNCRRPINADERSNRKGNIPYYGATGQVGWINDYLTDETLVLVGEDGAPFLDAYKEKSYIINGKAWVNNHAHLIKTNDDTLSSKYLCHCLNKTDYQNLVTGSTRLKLTQSSLEKILIPLPPLSEQKRIVAKIEQVFEQLDRVEKSLGE